MQSLEQEVTLGAITSISGIVRNSETSTKSFTPYLELQEQIKAVTSCSTNKIDQQETDG